MSELDRLGWAAERTFEVGGLLFGLRTNSREFIAWADEVLGDFRVRDAEAGPYYSVVVGGTEGIGKHFHILYRESDAIVRSFDLGLVGRALLIDVGSLTFAKRDDALYLNMSLVS